MPPKTQLILNNNLNNSDSNNNNSNSNNNTNLNSNNNSNSSNNIDYTTDSEDNDLDVGVKNKKSPVEDKRKEKVKKEKPKKIKKRKSRKDSQKQRKESLMNDPDVIEQLNTKVMKSKKEKGMIKNKNKKKRTKRKSKTREKKTKSMTIPEISNKMISGIEANFPHESLREGYHFNHNAMNDEIIRPSKKFNSGYESDMNDFENENNTLSPESLLNQPKKTKLQESDKLPSKNKKVILDMINPFTESMRLVSKYRDSKNKKKSKLNTKIARLIKLNKLSKKKKSLVDKLKKHLSKKKHNNLHLKYHPERHPMYKHGLVSKSDSMSKTTNFVYSSSLNDDGKLREFGKYSVNNSKKPFIIEGLIKDGQITEKMVKK